jgi:hypothetical protein
VIASRTRGRLVRVLPSTTEDGSALLLRVVHGICSQRALASRASGLARVWSVLGARKGRVGSGDGRINAPSLADSVTSRPPPACE